MRISARYFFMGEMLLKRIEVWQHAKGFLVVNQGRFTGNFGLERFMGWELVLVQCQMDTGHKK
jgi:hypothetical protein